MKESENAAAPIAENPAPNLESLQCKGQTKINQGVIVSLKGQSLEWGKWGTDPATAMTGPSVANWMAQGRLASSSGAEGRVIYKAADDATFTFYFDVPYSGTNKAQMSCDGKDCSLYDYSVSPVSPRGDVISPVYTISKK